jgi:hypothetical protein
MEEAKFFDFGSPERIAKFYGGNKQKIFQALQSGALRRFAPAPMDATLAAATADFIDQMRNAAQVEAAPQQTVFQQLFAPPAPPAPMGGAPAGIGAPPAPPQPPMGAPAGLGATPEAAAMASQMPPMPQGGPGMAMGGMVPPYASGGGLSDMPLPDGMFDEPSNGGFGDGYANGGLVAFLTGGEVKDKDKNSDDINGDGVVDEKDVILVNAPQKVAPPRSLGGGVAFDMPSSIAGMSSDMMTNLTNYQDMYTPERKQQDRLIAAYEEELTPESIRKAKKQDMWMALGQIGAKMATTPGSILQAASAGIGEALPGIAAAAKERKADQRQLLKNLQEQEGLTNKEAKEAANIALEMQTKYGTLYQALQDNSFKERWAQMDDDTRRYIAKLTASSSAYGAQLGLQGTLGAARYGYERELAQQQGLARKYVFENIGPGGVFQLDYTNAPNKTKFINDKVNEVMGGASGVVDVPWKP